MKGSFSLKAVFLHYNSNMNTQTSLPKRTLSVAPMLDWTDRHYRHMARQITRHTWLYTEMINAGAIVYGDPDRFLQRNECENPVALQLGGSEPTLLAQAAQKAAQYGYDEINLNCGCPSPRVQKGSFGACLMLDVNLVADCLNAMQDAVPAIPITIKHRIGIDKQTEYQPLADFVGSLHDKTACRTFIVHARNAWLDGLSPKENREIPPLRYDFVYRLKQEFPDLEIIINGGVQTNTQIAEHLQHVDGVMMGREAYHNPYIMHDWDTLFYGEKQPAPTREQIAQQLYNYATQQLSRQQGTILRHMVRHYLGLTHGLNGAKIWRRMLSDADLLRDNRPELILEAWQQVEKMQAAFESKG
ncbi:tRNA dihydrouridine(20/20a) synthase DusA [Kingella kingae]|uniref:tRNA dihydrouridine(20/20a) synthase DusA n=1 Tax=Kingella kingae TaxID=504 RepID=UPI00041CA8F8|nr:tRNA dihydrouridine(20/20a) synthase DusA [Kingella kingae]MDK4573789.1 tRNA dihydrouridine(20/20a) synthase DusA [Kingella kingae]MDK4605942.1 tRNA dihydrouridine(20/20a) synthase DusA [Kingella kingae]